MGAALAATASSRPSARRARTPLAGRYMPVPASAQPASRSISSGANPARPSALASASPASPPPTTKIRARCMSPSLVPLAAMGLVFAELLKARSRQGVVMA